MSTLAAHAALPFAGLGISLDPVIRRTEGMVLKRMRLDIVRTHHRHTHIPSPAGYRLLVGLSREIRGR